MSGFSMPAPSFYARQEARQEDEVYHPHGLINSPVAGRTDRIPMSVPAESHVLPADVVSGVGQSNTMAGAKILDAMFGGKVGPYGAAMPPPHRGPGPPRPIAAPRPHRADGGEAGVSKVLTAGGEYVVGRDKVAEIGARQRATGKSNARTDLKAGHEALDQFIAKVRKENIKWLKHAPSPKK